jgi:hypothetical protein
MFMDSLLTKNDANVLAELEKLIGVEIPKLRSIKAATTGLYSFGYEEDNQYYSSES